MQSTDQSSKLFFFYILQFINEHYDGRVGFFRNDADCLQQGRHVLLKVPVVGESGFGVKIQSDFNICVFEFQRFGKTGKCLESPFGHILHSFDLTELQQSDSKL